jgi:hypothetical protein
MDQKANGVEPVNAAGRMGPGWLQNPADIVEGNNDRHMGMTGSERNIPMRFLVTAAICFSVVLPLTAEAQTRLPRRSTSERQAEDINRDIQQGRRLQNVERQIQIDQNQLRQDIDRQRVFSNPPSSLRNCPVGAVC